MVLGLDDLFWATIALIFLATLAGALIRRVRRDECLRLFHDSHVTVLLPSRPVLWGDMFVHSQGAHVVFDSPAGGSGLLAKSGALIYAEELAQVVAVCRTRFGLTREELAERERQLRRRVDPPVWRRAVRAAGNLVNLVRDAIVNTLGLLVGRITGKSPVAAAVKAESGRISKLGGALVDVVANAYEPLLERLIGKPVVLELRMPDGAPVPAMEFGGYLAEYNDRYVAILNPEQELGEVFELETLETVEGHGCRLEAGPETVTVDCTGLEAIVVRKLRAGEAETDVGAVLLPGHRLALRRPGPGLVCIEAFATRSLDLVCPRGRARVRFSGDATRRVRASWKGAAPEVDVSEDLL